MNRLKELRKANGLTQLQVQIKAGIEQAEYSRMEAGKRMPTLEQAIALAIIFHTNIDYIVGLTDISEPYPTGKKEFPYPL